MISILKIVNIKHVKSHKICRLVLNEIQIVQFTRDF